MSTEHEQLLRLVRQWNENRLDLFHLTEPSKDLEVEGVMRFYFQDFGERVATKCIRVSSTATTCAVIEALIAKFVPDLKMLTNPEYSLWEIHENGEERRLESDEKPLVVQLMWHKDDREGRFVLKKHGTPPLPLAALQLHDDNEGVISRSFKRFSKRSEKDFKKKIVSVNAGREEEYHTPDIYQQVPLTNFTRTISNPEVVMKKRRERKLEAKLNELGHQGGSLKIYGGDLDPARPYVTLLVSLHDRAGDVLREALEKYNLRHLRVEDVCLVESSCSPDLRRSFSDLRSIAERGERVLHPDECPLIIIANRQSRLPEIFFYIRRRDNYYNRISSTSTELGRILPARGSATDPAFVFQKSDGGYSVMMSLLPGITEVGSDSTLAQFSPQNLILSSPSVRGRHCVITFDEGVVTVTPSASNAHIEVNGQRVLQTVILSNGDAIRLGDDCVLYFVDSKANADHLPAQLFNLLNNPTTKSRRLSGSSMDSSVFSASQDHRPSAVYNIPQTAAAHSNSAFGPPISIQIGNYRVWDFLNEILHNGYQDTSQFRLAPAFALYLALRYFQQQHKPVLLQFLTRISTELNKKAQECVNADEAMFWLSNASELSFLVSSDAELHGGSLNACVEPLLMRVVALFGERLRMISHSLLEEGFQDDEATAETLDVLNVAVRSARTARLNAALTIQIASQLFHILNVQLFNMLMLNKEPRVRLTRVLGERLLARLRLISDWAEKNGIELAAECHLHSVSQAAAFLAAAKTDVEEMGAACDKLNSLQVRHIFAHYSATENEPPFDSAVVSAIVSIAEKHADRSLIQQGRQVTLEEPVGFPLPFELPNEGYVSEQLFGTPEPLLAYIIRLQHKGLLTSAATLDSRAQWLGRGAGMEQRRASAPQHSSPIQNVNNVSKVPTSNSSFGDSFGSSAGTISGPPFGRSDEIIRVALKKSHKGIGLSIVAAQGVGDPDVGIYVKKVVEDGPAFHDGRLAPGDQLLSVNSVPLINISQEEAALRMGSTGIEVVFEVRKGAALRNGLAQWLCQTTPSASENVSFAAPLSRPVPQFVPRMASTARPPEPIKHQRSNSASDLFVHDLNASISNRSICSTDFAPPTAGGSTRLPSRYRPTVIQPSRASGGAQSPSALRRGAPSPGALQRPPSESAIHRPTNIYEPPPTTLKYNNTDNTYQANERRTPSSFQQNVQNAPVFRASPPLSQSSPRQPTRCIGDEYANLPLASSRHNDFAYEQLPREPVHLTPNFSKKEPAVVRIPEPTRPHSQEAHRTTTFGVTGAVPTPLAHLSQNQLQQGPNFRKDFTSQLDRDVRHLEQRSRQSISGELDRLETKGFDMTEAETLRYRQLLDEMAAEKRQVQNMESASKSRRVETVIDDVSPDQMHPATSYATDFEPMDSPSIVGAHEVYRDPRSKRFENHSQAPLIDGSNLAFQDKMRLFAKQIGESTPKGRSTESSAQRLIERE